ncbi:MAG: hypothetical protein HKO53_03750 [Gemmatimonadetes bacterium]|nr:hypothetical protein [Gemmatimonadota bacterium]
MTFWQTSKRGGLLLGRSGRALPALSVLAVALLSTPGPAAAQPADPVVRRVIVERWPIFSDADRARLPWLPLGLVNAAHVDTREHVIRRELVFAPGDRVDADDLDEAERKLRQTGYFSEAWVEPVVVAPDTVDVLVRTQELWTTVFNGSYEKFEDELLWALEIRERNFLGNAKQFTLSRRVDEDRSTWTVGLGDRQLFGSRWRAEGRLSSSDDGDATSWRIDRPFFRLESDWSLGASYFHGGARPRYYTSGGHYVRPRADFTSASAYVSNRISSTPHGVWRTEAGIFASGQRFAPETGLELEGSDELSFVDFRGGRRENRDVHAPYVALERVSSRYTQQRFLFSMGRIEDLAQGFEHRLLAGYANRWFGGTPAGLVFDTDQSFLSVGDRGAVRVTLDTSGIVTSGHAENLRASAFTGAYLRFRPDTLLALGLLGGTSTRLDRHQVFQLGGENGLRAAGFREFAGDRLLRANAELRGVYRPGLLGLVTPGLTAFVDFGAAWFEDEEDVTWKSIRGAVGFGIRIGLNRATTNRPIRVDLGWPILYDNERSSPILSIGSGQVF